MNDEQRYALCDFMNRVLLHIHPYHNIEYPFEELRRIEESEGENSDKFIDYSESIQEAYWMKKDIAVIQGLNIWSKGHDSHEKTNALPPPACANQFKRIKSLKLLM